MIHLAHGVGRVYESPFPVWLYGAGAALTVLLSFILRAVVVSAPKDRDPKVLIGERGARIIITVFRVAGVAALALTLVAGTVVRNRGLSLAPLLFWIGLIVGTAALSGFVAGVWEVAGPWRTLEGFYRFEEAEPRGGPPWWVGPVLLYALFWFELVSGGRLRLGCHRDRAARLFDLFVHVSDQVGECVGRT